ncbi:hypothetical protein Rt10032_c03g1588 [Rhodotorula toruloides]|uniref:Uncharacterized protein n=1 Tax=Rhodotorula toruloides TaxID=5286 RepID=A0A511KB46_RHOTO|nr:hypothetical protein Rt10032_c03g1588 [Rhodotorula toruloides]
MDALSGRCRSKCTFCVRLESVDTDAAAAPSALFSARTTTVVWAPDVQASFEIRPHDHTVAVPAGLDNSPLGMRRAFEYVGRSIGSKELPPDGKKPYFRPKEHFQSINQ